jgi:hypothetical protein
MTQQQSADHPILTEEQVVAAERKMRHWEAEHHFKYKLLMSPTVAAAVFGASLTLFGAVLTIMVNWGVEAAKRENALILELIKNSPPDQVLSRLHALEEAAFFQEAKVRAAVCRAHGKSIIKT